MKTANEANATTRYGLVRDVAARLGKNPLFAGGGNAVCRLYANVPFKYVELDGTPLEDTSADFGDCVSEDFNDCVLDLLVCRSGSHEAVLAIIFDPDGKRAGPPISHIQIYSKPEQTPEDITKFIENCVDNWLDSQFEEPASLPRFTLRPLPAEDVTGETGDALRAHLIRERLSLGNGSVTTYGCGLGLLEQLYSDGSGKSCRRWAVIQHKADDIKEALSPGTKPLSGAIPLATRLERLKSGLPCDEPYAAFLAESLQRLLETPIDFLCGGDPLTMTALEDELEQAQFLLDYDCGPVRTYADVLGIVRELYRGYWHSGHDRSEKTEKADKILMFLAGLLVNPPAPPLKKAEGPLKEHLSGLGAAQDTEYPILSVPVAHYYYAASILDGSNYPNWIFKYRFYIRETDKLRIGMAYTLKRYLGEIPGRSVKDILMHPYDLLVEPIFPNVDPEQN